MEHVVEMQKWCCKNTEVLLQKYWSVVAKILTVSLPHDPARPCGRLWPSTHKIPVFPFLTLELHTIFKESIINRLWNPINRSRLAAKISHVLCSNYDWHCLSTSSIWLLSESTHPHLPPSADHKRVLLRGNFKFGNPNILWACYTFFSLGVTI